MFAWGRVQTSDTDDCASVHVLHVGMKETKKKVLRLSNWESIHAGEKMNFANDYQLINDPVYQVYEVPD